MKKINDKTIRGIIVVVGLALSFVLILMIGSKFKKEPVTETHHRAVRCRQAAR